MPQTNPRDAHTQYESRLEAHRAQSARLKRQAAWLSNARLAVFLLAVVMAWFVWETKDITAGWMALPLVSFLVLMILHARIIRALERVDRAVVFYQKGLARLEGQWAGSGDAGVRFLEESHPYARDLDLFGEGSIFELLCTTQTPWGAQALAEWILSPASRAVVLSRQVAVRELEAKLDLREELAIVDEEISPEIDPRSLVQWASSPSALTSRAVRVVTFVLAAVSVVVVVGWLASYVHRSVALMVLAVEAIFAMWLRPRVEVVIAAADKPDRELGMLSQILHRLEKESFISPQLIELQQLLSVGGLSASRQIHRLRRLIELMDLRLNKMFAPVAMLLLWGTQFAFALESWRSRSGPSVGRWLRALGEMEALIALATFSYEHPDDSFPELAEEGPLFEGEGIGHPLIPENQLVRNDIQLGKPLHLFVVSGSNMSGKSTLLRTIGINSVLALAGAPVRARHLRLSVLAVGASIRIVDSLQEGVSRFYAEIKRLRQIMDLTEEPLPLVFLLDEIFHGTNSHDRRIGAEAVVRGLVERGAIGLITTHDLALSKVAESLAAAAQNVHFEDHLEDGKMVFDYRLRSGVVQKSNALALMRSVGLEV